MIIAQTQSPIIISANAAENISCPAVTMSLKLGAANNAKEVRNLQGVLKNIEKINVDITGVFDKKTEDGVKEFQKKYVSEIMAPYGVKSPTGIVGVTTAKKINNIACNTPMTMSPADLASVTTYGASTTTSGAVSAGAASAPAGGLPPGVSVVSPAVLNVSSSDLSVPGNDDTYSSTDDDSGVSAVMSTENATTTDTSVRFRFWKFFWGLFGR